RGLRPRRQRPRAPRGRPRRTRRGAGRAVRTFSRRVRARLRRLPMRMRRLPSHPAFKLEGRSRHFQAFWELELTPGEETSPHQHYESEEVIYLVSGNAHVTVARQEKTVQPGEVVLVPPRTDHVIANRSEDLVHALTVESLLDLGDEAG